MKIETYISDLLYRHDCVIIPGLGGIITNYRSAQIHPVSHKLQPPSKSIRFNINLQEDDGLLANYVSSCEEISFASAQTKIERFVFSIRRAYQIDDHEPFPCTADDIHDGSHDLLHLSMAFLQGFGNGLPRLTLKPSFPPKSSSQLHSCVYHGDLLHGSHFHIL